MTHFNESVRYKINRSSNVLLSGFVNTLKYTFTVYCVLVSPSLRTSTMLKYAEITSRTAANNYINTI